METGLLAQAQDGGLDVADYVGNLVRKVIAANGHVKSQPAHRAQRKKTLSELFAPFRGLDLDFSRNPSTGRPVKS